MAWMFVLYQTLLSADGYKQKVVATPQSVRCPSESRCLQPGANVCW